MTVVSAGRHRTPGRYNPLVELRLIAKESAQPAVKGAAIVAASGGLIASFSPSAGAGEPVAGAGLGDTTGSIPAVVGPAAGLPVSDDALSAIGLASGATRAGGSSAPTVIEDVVLKQRKEAALAASRSLTRRTLLNSTAAVKSTSNTTRATVGKRSSYNWATYGQCTWGALEQWHRSEGYYLGGFTGNALTWAWGAANAGYTVSGTPRVRSIVVMQPGVYGSSSAGHVAWVTAVNGNQVTILEMNALAGPGRYDTRTLTDISGMKYIYAP
ncbi:NLP/P60 protein [Intrasporangium oryzae NRRL B-24470]|uniref:NLP/P60 protein n=1 Tax=Intrasporangium oryzae NRRL B-24470 TaxID=1386089 RepID=W9GDV5_9MICO|nr:CHAP domain-containing protein [Intrasporangium oryzae]EWT03402.1 NLP/P60 protein [Intrasporangium oryzae NRRL B-24470]